MTINIINQYIELTKKQINEYMKLVFENNFNKKYCDMYTEKYINTRYYNFYEKNENNTIRTRILDNLRELQEELEKKLYVDKKEIENIRVFYYFVLYFDNVVYYKDLEKIIQKITKLREKTLGKKKDGFDKKLYLKMTECIKQKEEFIKKFETNEFYIKLSNYPEKLHIYRVNLKYNIEFPLTYSNYAVEKAFATGIIDEDKLVVEYYLITMQILKDILKQNFKKQYVVEFSSSLLKKPKKLKSLLNIINGTSVQEKLSIKIRYGKFIKNKDKVYDLMRKGYKIAIVMDDTFEVNAKNLQSLDMFKYVIVNKTFKDYEKIKDRKNIIEI